MTDVVIRKLDGFDFMQRVDNLFVSLNDILKIGNKRRTDRGDSIKIKAEYWKLPDTEDFLQALMASEGYTQLSQIKMRDGGRNAKGWVHPFIAVDFALWVEPSLKVPVYKMVMDELVSERLGGKGSFKRMNEALDAKYNIGGDGWVYANVANQISSFLDVKDWQRATKYQHKKRDEIQNAIILLCDVLPDTPLHMLVARAIDSVSYIPEDAPTKEELTQIINKGLIPND